MIGRFVRIFRSRRQRKRILLAAVILVLFCSKGCVVNYCRWKLFGELEVEATAYCNCGECCGWELDPGGRPVYAKGRLKGRKKIVGMTCSGAMASRGTVAADLSVIPMGTRLRIPGYGHGIVQDTGRAIKGARIDLWFPTHEEAQRWGRKTVRISRLQK